jgi:hypothetical protein
MSFDITVTRTGNTCLIHAQDRAGRVFKTELKDFIQIQQPAVVTADVALDLVVNHISKKEPTDVKEFDKGVLIVTIKPLPSVTFKITLTADQYTLLSRVLDLLETEETLFTHDYPVWSDSKDLSTYPYIETALNANSAFTDDLYLDILDDIKYTIEPFQDKPVKIKVNEQAFNLPIGPVGLSKPEYDFHWLTKNAPILEPGFVVSKPCGIYVRAVILGWFLQNHALVAFRNWYVYVIVKDDKLTIKIKRDKIKRYDPAHQFTDLYTIKMPKINLQINDWHDVRLVTNDLYMVEK